MILLVEVSPGNRFQIVKGEVVTKVIKADIIQVVLNEADIGTNVGLFVVVGKKFRIPVSEEIRALSITEILKMSVHCPLGQICLAGDFPDIWCKIIPG